MSFTALVLDVKSGDVYPAKITIEDGIFTEVTPIDDRDHEMDVQGLMIPGFIDAHIHIESTMLTPAQFAKIAVRHGTTSVVCDPHEIANVHGVEGVEFMIENASQVPFHFYFSAPSCVPATLFETSGEVLDAFDIEYLLQKKEVVALGEMMNFPGVINGDEEVLKKLEVARKYKKPIDGHAPLLEGEDLDKYIAQDILTDHECTSFSEAIIKKMKGMKIQVRDGAAAKNMEALFDLNARREYLEKIKNQDVSQFKKLEKIIEDPIFDFIVSDDKHLNELTEGYLNGSIKKAVGLGIDIKEAIKMVTINPSDHYNLNSGVIAEGAKADFVIVDNLDEFNILKTYVSGECVFDGENVLFDVPEIVPKNSIKARKMSADDFDIHYDGDECKVNVIECIDKELITNLYHAALKTEGGIIQSDVSQDILKIAVVERHGKNHVANGFIRGFGFKNGAMASSIAHDSHNIIVIGETSQKMAEAVNEVIDNKGGISIVGDGFKESLALPIAGLMSNEDVYKVSSKLAFLRKLAASLGCNLNSPFMTMSFMALLVIPSVRLSDMGLFDVENFEFIDVIID